jgi:hypothetical protein
VLVLSACASGSVHTATSPPSVQSATTTTATSTTQPPPPTAAPAATVPHFDTPVAAMRYLTAAWNSNNEVDLRHVTTPAVRDQLDAMHSVAANLTLDHCDPRPGLGDYVCYFHHD